jgi:hypothetical protein
VFRWARTALADLPLGLVVLGCYLVWYLVTLWFHFDPSPRIWLNSVGLSVLIGWALVLSVGWTAVRRSSPWVTVRLFLMPFCVSSFSALIKDAGFLLILSPNPTERFVAFGGCAAWLTMVALCRWGQRRSTAAA